MSFNVLVYEAHLLAYFNRVTTKTPTERPDVGDKNLGWKLGILGLSLTSATYLLCHLGQVTSVWTSVCSPARTHSWGPGTSFSCSFHLVTLPASWFGSGRGPSPSPRLACLLHPPFQKEHPSPFLPELGPGKRWAAERTGGGETIPAVQASVVSAGLWPVTTGPEIQRGICLGDPGSI